MMLVFALVNMQFSRASNNMNISQSLRGCEVNLNLRIGNSLKSHGLITNEKLKNIIRFYYVRHYSKRISTETLKYTLHFLYPLYITCIYTSQGLKVIVYVARQHNGLSISTTSDLLGVSHTTSSRVYTEHLRMDL